MAEQLRMQSESRVTKDPQIAALTEQVVKLTAQIDELTNKKKSNNSSKLPSGGRLEKRVQGSSREKWKETRWTTGT